MLYDLFAVCNHYGRMGCGHYTAMARDWDFTAKEPHTRTHTQSEREKETERDELCSQWFLFDDHKVRPISEDEVCTESAYILFYRRRS